MSGKPRIVWGEAAAAFPAMVLDDLADERRWAQRKRSVLAATIISDRLQGTVGCVVRDLSATGAQVDLKFSKTSVISSVSGLPDQFVLVLLRDNSEVSCQTAWRRGDSAGVHFIGAFRTLPKRAPAPARKNKK